ncbi:MAG: FHA domain-containing protein, partial [Clostridia bacterium]|nr:FHA domain-containing protein [Deltaproteobacteria bacterium]
MDTSSFKLIIEDDEGRRSVVAIDLETERDGISIGRQEGNVIRLNERNVSRRHARFMREQLGIFAEDLDSYNGVWVNGDRIKGRQELHDGDTVRVGDFQLELRGEGLQRRVEEVTQRTMLGDGSETTRPDIRLEAQMNGGPLSPNLPPLGGPSTPNLSGGSNGASHAEAHGQGRVDLPSRTPTIDEDDPGPEPTALVRVPGSNTSAETDRGAQVVAGQRARLICVSTQFAGSEFDVDKAEVVIGRTDEN